MYVITCPSCKKRFRVKVARLGASATCSGCNARFKLDKTTLRQHSEAAPATKPVKKTVPVVSRAPVAKTEKAPPEDEVAALLTSPPRPAGKAGQVASKKTASPGSGFSFIPIAAIVALLAMVVLAFLVVQKFLMFEGAA